MTSWILERQAKAVKKVKAELTKPLPADENDMHDGTFDPWDMFPIYGSYSSEFDDMALTVLRNLERAAQGKWDEQTPESLPHHIFREMLCVMELCDYGTSPRVCFANPGFEEVLPELIAKWEAYYVNVWGASHD